jgi:hypothetical protein
VIDIENSLNWHIVSIIKDGRQSSSSPKWKARLSFLYLIVSLGNKLRIKVMVFAFQS